MSKLQEESVNNSNKMKKTEGVVQIVIPKFVQKVLRRLERYGFEGYLVGGCVRDFLLQKRPKDFDLATSALPEEIVNVFSDCQVIKTGLKHGTVTVIFENQALEITTYRKDGGYSDHRRPDLVSFCTSIKEDLARRDFTINAMAYNESNGLIDYYGGQSDLEKKLLRCVGEPTVRFQEDALRILRLLRFASELGFEIDNNTAQKMKVEKALLETVSKERINEECTKILCGAYAGAVIGEWIEVIGVVLPELLPMEGFKQNNPHHKYDVLRHTAVVLDSIESKPYLRWAALLHDVGKPWCYSVDGRGMGHFYGHANESEIMAGMILNRLKMDHFTMKKVADLIRYHDIRMEAQPFVIKRWLCKLGKETFEELLLLKKADLAGQNSLNGKKEQKLTDLCNVTKQILESGQCYQLCDLQVNGTDLLDRGMKSGQKIGNILQYLLESVMDESVFNEKETLLRFLELEGIL